MSSMLATVKTKLNISSISLSLVISLHAPQSFAQNSGEFHPVVVTSTSGEIDPESQKMLVENFSEVIRTSSLRSLGREFYGTSAKDGFAGESSKGPIGLLRKALVSMDKDMAERATKIHSKLRAPTSDSSMNRMELFWSKRDIGASALGTNGDSLGVLLKILGPSVRKESQTTNPFALQLGQKAVNLQIGTMAQVPGGRASLIAESKDAYGELKQMNEKAWIPLHVDSLISIDKSKTITTKIAVTMIPVGFKFDKEKVGDFKIEATTYKPELDGRSVIRIYFQRTYGANNTNRPPMLIKVNFGPMKSDSTEANVCVGDACLKKVDAVPTIHAVMDAGWLKNFFSKALSLNKFQILISSLGINIEDLSVDPKTSELPMLLKTYTFGWKVVDMKRNTRPLNPLEAIQKTLVGDQVSAGLSDRLQSEGANAEKSVNESLQAIVDLFR